MTGVSTHVLDTARGRPAAGVGVELAVRDGGAAGSGPGGGGWRVLAVSATDADGRCRDLPDVPDAGGPAGGAVVLRLRFATGAYLPAPAFLPEVSVVFAVEPGQDHYHVPLLLSPYGYSVYRGS
ncbi:hydroxyisourate hydrolase [Streptomyces sp. NPDC001380]|uniref:hydroxyisourate hydrolase n=1 Tax=Streptomyces sp. NPDC001380 TaxID=3364566 RepID=UPI00369D0833